MMIWESYLYKNLTKVFLFFLFALFFLYAIFDSSLHLQSFMKNPNFSFSRLLVYYVFQFVKRSEAILSFALLIAAIKVLFSLTVHHEWLAFQTAGLENKKLLRPFFTIAMGCCIFLLCNYELLYPHVTRYIDHFEKINKQFIKKGRKTAKIHSIKLEDNTKLIFQFMPHKEGILDLFWIISPQEIWHAKSIVFEEGVPVGRKVDFLEKDAYGKFYKFASFDTYAFHGMKLNYFEGLDIFVCPENRSISSLFKGILNPFHDENDYSLKTNFYYKLFIPLVPLITILGICPFCIRYKRKTRAFTIYCLGISGLFAFFMLMDACVIMGESGAMPPLFAIAALPFLLSGCFIWNFIKN